MGTACGCTRLFSHADCPKHTPPSTLEIVERLTDGRKIIALRRLASDSEGGERQ